MWPWYIHDKCYILFIHIYLAVTADKEKSAYTVHYDGHSTSICCPWYYLLIAIKTKTISLFTFHHCLFKEEYIN